MRFFHGILLSGLLMSLSETSPRAVHHETSAAKKGESVHQACTIPTTGPHSSQLPCSLEDLLDDDGKPFYQWVTHSNPTSPQFDQMLPADKRRCDGDKDCLKKKKVTWVNIVPTVDANKVNLDNLPEYGYVVGFLIQEKGSGKYQEFKYHLPVSTDTAYLVVEPGQAIVGGYKTGNWTFVYASKDFSTDISQGTYYRCMNDSIPPTSPYARFGTCQSNHPAARAAIARYREANTTRARHAALTDLNAALVTSGFYDDPAWMSCYHGC